MNNPKKLLLLFLLLSNGLTSCATPKSENPTFGNLLNSSCSAPCWFGVTPGKTSKDELVKLIPEFPYYQENHVIWMDEQYNSSSSVPNTSNSTFNMIVDNNWAGIEVGVTDNIVSSILISSILDDSFEYKDLKFTLDDILSLYGKPSDVFLDTGCSNGTCQNLYLVYSEKSVLVVVESQDLSLDVEILPTLPVRNVVFFKPYGFKDSLSRLTNVGECDLLSFKLAWQGYTTLQFSHRLWECN